jgi:hypothetical protein
MEFLPKLDIEEDLAILEDMDEPVINVTETDLSVDQVEDKPMDIFVGKPTNNNKVSRPSNKKQVKIKEPKQTIKALTDIEEEEEVEVKPLKKVKKPLSEKQKAHLERIRVKALEKKKEKAAMRKAALQKVNEDYEAKKTYKKRTIKPNPKIIKEDIEHSQPNNLTPEQNTIKKQQQQTKPKSEDDSFIDFMSNMGKYQHYMTEYNKKQAVKTKPKPALRPVVNPDVKIVKSTPTPIPKILKQQPDNPYDSIFKW